MTRHVTDAARKNARAPDWITLGLILTCYGLWMAVTALFYPVSAGAAVLVTAVLVALHSSLTHEALHGHPFRSRALNEALMAFPLSLCIPYRRFRDLHLAHHRDSRLTDPFDDPESNFLDPDMWQAMPGWKRRVFAVNNTLLGRILLGPAIGQAVFVTRDWRAIRCGDRSVLWAWVWHVPGVLVVLSWIIFATQMPVWAYLIAAYAGLGLVKIRTFLEHQAHAQASGRTVIIEDRGPLAFLFLNNNLHVVHHMHPQVAWYRLPALYRANKAWYLRRNGGYCYRSYGEIFAKYLVRAKDPVAHPLWRRS